MLGPSSFYSQPPAPKNRKQDHISNAPYSEGTLKPPKPQRVVDVSRMRRTETDGGEEMPPPFHTQAPPPPPHPIICAPFPVPSTLQHTRATQPHPPFAHHPGPQFTRHLAPHDTGRGAALTEKDSPPREPVIEGNVYVYVLHRVLYPQVHENGF
jgi:hypothetical protein